MESFLTVTGGAQAIETARSLKSTGPPSATGLSETTRTSVAPSDQDKGSGNSSVWTSSAPAALKAATPQSTARCIAGVPGTRPPIWSESTCKFFSIGDGFRASSMRRSALLSCAKAAIEKREKEQNRKPTDTTHERVIVRPH